MKSRPFLEPEVTVDEESFPYDSYPQAQAVPSTHHDVLGQAKDAAGHRRSYSMGQQNPSKRQRRDSYQGLGRPKELEAPDSGGIQEFTETKQPGSNAAGDCQNIHYEATLTNRSGEIKSPTSSLTQPTSSLGHFAAAFNAVSRDLGLKNTGDGQHIKVEDNELTVYQVAQTLQDSYMAEAMRTPATSLAGGTQTSEVPVTSGTTLCGSDAVNQVHIKAEEQLVPDIKNEYDIDSLDEQDMAALLDAVVEAPPLVPPSSVIRGMDCGSSDEIFDPNLRGSSPNKSPTSALQNQNVDLLDEDVDWDEVMDNVLEPVAPEDSIISSHKPPAPVPLPATEPLTQTDRPLPRPPQPFVRPKFPDPVRDKSPIAGISHTSILRICFRIGELLNEGKRASLASQDVVFELFARVSYSSRESNTQTTTTTYPRIQHFQFIDLYKDQLPYPTGKLTGWKTDSQTDCQSRVFLSPSGSAGRRKKGEAKLCRCVCRLKKDKKAELGWALEVLTIRETDWEEIELTKRAVCRE